MIYVAVDPLFFYGTAKILDADFLFYFIFAKLNVHRRPAIFYAFVFTALILAPKYSSLINSCEQILQKC